MRSEFDKWHYLDFCKVNECEDSAQVRNLYKSIFSMDENDAEKEAQYRAWQYCHSKMDEIKASCHGELIGHIHHLNKIKQERDSLKKGLYDALLICGSGSALSFVPVRVVIEQTLKGATK